MEPLNNNFQELKDNFEKKHGLLCLNCLFNKSRFEEIEQFIEKHNIPTLESDVKPSKYDLLKSIASYFYQKYKDNAEIQSNYKDPLYYIGNKVLEDEKLKHYLTRFDFFARQDLIDAFSDWCADLGISVYDASKINNKNIDLYLIRRTPLLRSEAAFVRTGAQLDEENYKNTFYLINEASKLATWTVFVTTPLGVYNIGLERMVSDMEKLNTWLYVINPLHKEIHGITKGGKSKDYDSDLRDNFIEKLPKEPIRAPSKVIEISKYEFDDDISYKPKNYSLFEIFTEEEMQEIQEESKSEHKYRNIFRNLMIIDKDAGLPLISYTSEEKPLDKVLISGFLTAMDNFVSEIGGESAMKDINYKGLYVQASYGKNIKAALFLSDPADKSLKERLNYLVNYIETHYNNEIQEFRKTGDTSNFDEKKINPLIIEILDM
ncbi:MAG: hypothetical protein ACQERB_01950 [Promethearchaeati archaeon]